jgi:serine/threonine protein kinase
LVGTLEYLSPEVVLGNEATFSSDLWAFGVIIFLIFTGKSPFKNGETDIKDNILNLRINWVESIPPVVKDLISKLLVLDPE